MSWISWKIVIISVEFWLRKRGKRGRLYFWNFGHVQTVFPNDFSWKSRLQGKKVTKITSKKTPKKITIITSNKPQNRGNFKIKSFLSGGKKKKKHIEWERIMNTTFQKSQSSRNWTKFVKILVQAILDIVRLSLSYNLSIYQVLTPDSHFPWSRRNLWGRCF